MAGLGNAPTPEHQTLEVGQIGEQPGAFGQIPLVLRYDLRPTCFVSDAKRIAPLGPSANVNVMLLVEAMDYPWWPEIDIPGNQ